MEVFSGELSLETKHVQLPFHSDNISSMSYGIAQADAPIATAMDYTSSSVDGNRVVSKSREHDIVLLASFAAC